MPVRLMSCGVRTLETAGTLPCGTPVPSSGVAPITSTSGSVTMGGGVLAAGGWPLSVDWPRANGCPARQANSVVAIVVMRRIGQAPALRRRTTFGWPECSVQRPNVPQSPNPSTICRTVPKYSR